jgi:uncharacterized protein YheU (UPF0270 family)
MDENRAGKETAKERGVEVPINALQPDTVQKIIEEFILREGTDYGAGEWSLAEKVSQVRRQLEQGRARILYDEETESCTLEVSRRTT